MSDEVLSLVLVGAGSIACSYANALQSVKGLRLAGVADICREKADRLAESYSCRPFSDLMAMLSEIRPDGAVICTPPAVHREICLKLSGMGVHMLCEKPFSLNAAEAWEMLDAASKASVTLMVSSKFRHMRETAAAKELIRSGRLGPVRRISNIFSSRAAMGSRWNSDPGISGGGVIIDNGTHSIDIFSYLAGPPVRIMASEGAREQGLSVEENARLHVETACGISGEIELSWDCDSPHDHFISVTAGHGEVQIGWRGSRYRCNPDEEWTAFGGCYDKNTVLAAQMEQFLKVVMGEADPSTSSAEILITVSAVDAAYESLRTGTWADIRNVREGRA